MQQWLKQPLQYYLNMRISKIILITSLFLLASCGKAVISGKLAVDSPKDIIVRELDLNVYNVLDTIKTDSEGNFQYKMQIVKGQPSFIYLFYGDTRIASLLLEQGDKVNVEADTLGNYSVSGSEACTNLSEIDKAYTKFNNDLYAARDNAPQMAKIYLDHYRSCVKYVLGNPYSLTTIPVLYQSLGDASSVFSQPSDALFFKGAADSLKTVYPDSRYVKALVKEADRRMKYLELDTRLRNAEELSFPEINLPNIDGERIKLSSVESKVILLHFWNVDNAEQKMMNIDTLLPLYEQYHSKGFEIYSVCVSANKTLWGTVVRSQDLPWINVFDNIASASSTLALYNVDSLPQSLLIIDGEMYSSSISGVEGLRKVLDKAFRR